MQNLITVLFAMMVFRKLRLPILDKGSTSINSPWDKEDLSTWTKRKLTLIPWPGGKWVDWLEASGRMSHDCLRSRGSGDYVRACAAVRACVVSTHICTPKAGQSLTCRSPRPYRFIRDSATFGTSSDVFARRLADPDGFNYSADRRADKRLPTGGSPWHSDWIRWLCVSRQGAVLWQLRLN